jgi:hypothetical protein
MPYIQVKTTIVIVIPERFDLETATYSIRRRLMDEMQDLPSLRLFPTFKAAGSADTLYYRNDSHLKAEGHRVIGRAIFEYLIQNKMIPHGTDN